MHGFKSTALLLLGALMILPGCLAVNAALGVLGVMGPPAAQLAGTAYTVAEYSYEYGAHGRTPDEVLAAKFDWIAGSGDEPEPAAFAGALSGAVPDPRRADAPRPATAVADAGPARAPDLPAKDGPQTPPSAKRIAKPAAKRAAGTRIGGKRMRTARLPDRTRPRGPSALPRRRTVPVHTYAAHAPDPLLARLDRVENGLAQAEALYLLRTTDGLRLSVPPRDGDPCAQGVNGGCSLRLPVMRTAPAALPAGRQRPQSTAPSGRSLNT